MRSQKKITLALIFILTIVITAITLNSGSNAVYTQNNIKSDTSGYFHREVVYEQLINSYDTFINHSLIKENLPGLAVVIVKDNQVLWLKGYGVKEFGTQDSIDENTVFRLGSVSKGFASVLSGILVNEKSLSWDDEVIKYLPDFSLKDSVYTKQLTIRNILSHTTGLPAHTYTDMLDCNVSYERIKPMLSNVPLISSPGKEYSYQNVAYSLIADILEAATGQDYKTLVENKIFTPLYMQHASLDYGSISTGNNVAKPHANAGNLKWNPLKFSDRYYSVSPASGVNASISDMGKWLLALLGNYPEFIPVKPLKEIYSPQIETSIKRKFRHNWKELDSLYYGLGWRVFNMKGEQIIYHGGYVRGYRAEISLDFNERTGIAVLFNSNCQLSNSCIPKFWELYFNNSMVTDIIAAN